MLLDHLLCTIGSASVWPCTLTERPGYCFLMAAATRSRLALADSFSVARPGSKRASPTRWTVVVPAMGSLVTSLPVSARSLRVGAGATGAAGARGGIVYLAGWVVGASTGPTRVIGGSAAG